jgi:hypothetical protein
MKLGCMRMRRLGHGQSVMFCAPAEIDTQIRKASGIGSAPSINTLDILRWAMLETCKDLQHHISHWAQQGVEHDRRLKAQRSHLGTNNVEALKQGWTTPESRSLEQMYGVSSTSTVASSGTFTKVALAIPSLKARLNILSVKMLQDPSLDEEQEREVSHENERERQIERPSKSRPAAHTVHEDVRQFIQTGSLSGSSAFISLFYPLRPRHPHDAAVWSPKLLATRDFSSTLAGSTITPLGDHIRPVNWIVSGIGGRLVALSPHEVDTLLPLIRESKFVRLHVYAPRITQAMRSFSDLQFYSVPPVHQPCSPPSPTAQLQLNIWAGQLYLRDYEEYRLLCAFLGLHIGGEGDVVGEDIVVQGDGFVKPADRQRLSNFYPAYIGCQFTKSPVNALKELFSHRRKGMEYMRTNVGQVLHGRLLTQNDFY